MNDLAASHRRPEQRPWSSLAALGLFAMFAGPVYAAGPDVTVYEMDDTDHFGPVGGIHAYSVATRSCNQGTVPLNWCDEPGGCGSGTTSHDHPVIAQNLYRLHDGRFSQIGMSWLKHGFTALQQARPGCGNGTCQATGGNFLGVGCTDPYTAGLNGSRPLGMRSEVNAANGAYPFPYTQVGASTTLDQRIQVPQTDLDPVANPGARYWVETQYVAPDDAAAGNGLNNASYREVSVTAGAYTLSFVAATVQELPAIAVWPTVDNTVELIAVDVPGSVPLERFNVARKVTDLGGGNWHYEYAIHNLNSDRSAGGFAVDFPDGTAITSVGFKDIDHHSGEPYDTSDWLPTVDGVAGTVAWAAVAFAPPEDANALRWATMFNFWFDANQPAGAAQETLTLFKPGSPSQVAVNFGPIFADGFESGNTSSWDPPTPGPFAPPATGR